MSPTPLNITLAALAVCYLFGGFAYGCRLARTHQRRNRVWWTLNRCRAWLASETDPGRWDQRSAK